MNGLVYTRIDDSPVGPLLLAGDDDGLRVLEFQMGSRARANRLVAAIEGLAPPF